jgi:hypothetical protein
LYYNAYISRDGRKTTAVNIRSAFVEWRRVREQGENRKRRRKCVCIYKHIKERYILMCTTFRATPRNQCYSLLSFSLSLYHWLYRRRRDGRFQKLKNEIRAPETKWKNRKMPEFTR